MVKYGWRSSMLVDSIYVYDSLWAVIFFTNALTISFNLSAWDTEVHLVSNGRWEVHCYKCKLPANVSQKFCQKLIQNRHVTSRCAAWSAFTLLGRRIGLTCRFLSIFSHYWRVLHLITATAALTQSKMAVIHLRRRNFVWHLSSFTPSSNFWNNPLSSAALPIPNSSHSCLNPHPEGRGGGKGGRSVRVVSGIRKGRPRTSLSWFRGQWVVMSDTNAI